MTSVCVCASARVYWERDVYSSAQFSKWFNWTSDLSKQSNTQYSTKITQSNSPLRTSLHRYISTSFLFLVVINFVVLTTVVFNYCISTLYAIFAFTIAYIYFTKVLKIKKLTRVTTFSVSTCARARLFASLYYYNQEMQLFLVEKFLTFYDK